MKIVVTARSGAREFECEPGEKILHAGLRSGVELPYECGTGTCGTCKAKLLKRPGGERVARRPGLRYLKGPSELLMCQSLAGEDCALEVGVLKTREGGTPLPGTLGGQVRGWAAAGPTTWPRSTSISTGRSTSTQASSRSSAFRASPGPRLLHGELSGSPRGASRSS